ncbi:hypothetical protein [Flavobacterium sp. N1946]|uniref:hypothetical protein n=1 Tax=Flavobacterium sp. N1946 TaxID=2986826 RepID=UPI002225110A|nr:hypothetical protein [Flavobacterium sp. N1946]
MLNDAIGGYFGLDLREKEAYHKEKKCIALNTSRNCLEYILFGRNYQLVFIPYFTCEAILEPFNKLNIQFEFYSIDENLEPIFDFNKLDSNAAFLYTNYFGLKDNYIKELAAQDVNLIIDNSQSFFQNQ